MRNNQKTQGRQCAGGEPVAVPGLCVTVNPQANFATVGEKTSSLAKNYGFGLKLRTEWLSLTVCFRAENGGANDLDVLVFLQLISQNKTSSQPCSKSLEGCVDRGRMEFWQMHGKQRCGVFEPKWLQGNWYLFKSASWTNKLAMYTSIDFVF